MNELLLRRRIAIINSTPSVPYDAEIEYLESNGTQHIELSPVTYSASNKYEIICEVMYTLSSVAHQLNGWDAGGAFGITNKISSNGSSEYIGPDILNTWVTHTLLIRSGTSSQTTLYVDVEGTLYEGSRAHGALAMYASNKGFHLFGCYSRNGVNYHVYEKIKTCKIYINDVLTCDLIPVRIGTTGYMYDKISGNLFGNDGTGSFVLGNDVN